MRVKAWMPGVAALIMLVGCNDSPSPAAPAEGDAEFTRVSAPPGEERPSFPFPESWRVTLEEAMSRAAFAVKVPDHADASERNVREGFLSPDGTEVVLMFPVPASAAAHDARQPHIQIYETPWQGGDPREDYAKSIALDPVTGKRIYEIDGVAALGVEAFAPEDEAGNNPAFLRFVLDGVEVQISGGDRLERLIAIARSIIARGA